MSVTFYAKLCNFNTSSQISVCSDSWLHIIVVNVHAPSEEKSEESKESFMRNYS